MPCWRARSLTGCVTAENSLSANDIASMKLTGVTVVYAPDASIRWDDGIRAYAAAAKKASIVPCEAVTSASSFVRASS